MSPKTIGLAVLALGLVLLNLLDPGSTPGGSTSEHFISPVVAADATRIELSQATSKVVLSSEAGAWSITSPIEHSADQAMVASILQVFRSERPLDVRVDTGNLTEYGLDASGGVVVEIWTGTDEPKVSLTIGNDAPGGTSFVRLSGDDGIYRAQLGGRARYQHTPAQWRNRRVLDFQSDQVQGISVKPPAGSVVHISRSPIVSESGGLGSWMVEPDPGWGLDSAGLDAVVSSLGTLSAQQVLADDFDGGFSPPAVELTVVSEDGTERVMAVGTTITQGLAHVRVTGGAAVYAVPVGPLKRFLTLDAEPQEDRTLFTVERAQMSALIYWEGRSSVQIAPDPTSGVWRPMGETPAPVDIADIQWAQGQLARLLSDGKVEGVGLAAAGVVPPNMVFEVQRQDGTHEAIYVGRTREVEGRQYYFVAKQNTAQLHLISADRIGRLRRAFGQVVR
jgi:hypothetical protein